ncbi:transporter [Paenibacillus sp. CAA11]|nr:transporter [Paenibacillus sp. CAA11]
MIDCLYRITDVRLWSGERFWYYPIRVSYGRVSGFRWNGLFWFYEVMNPGSIRSVSCSPIPTLY